MPASSASILLRINTIPGRSGGVETVVEENAEEPVEEATETAPVEESTEEVKEETGE